MFPIRVRSVVDERAYGELNKLVLGKKYAAFAAVYFLLLLFSLGVILWSYLKTSSIPIVMLVVSLLPLAGFITMLLMPSVIRKKIRKMIAKSGENECLYRFFEDRFEGEYANKLSSGDSKLSYSAFIKAVENNGYFFLFITRNSAHIVDKRGMTEEEAAALRDALRKYLPGKKYKLICK